MVKRLGRAAGGSGPQADPGARCGDGGGDGERPAKRPGCRRRGRGKAMVKRRCRAPGGSGCAPPPRRRRWRRRRGGDDDGEEARSGLHGAWPAKRPGCAARRTPSGHWRPRVRADGDGEEARPGIDQRYLKKSFVRQIRACKTWVYELKAKYLGVVFIDDMRSLRRSL